MAEHHVHFQEPHAELHCRRCGVPVSAEGHAVYFSEHGELGWLPLCETHMNEVWELVQMYVGGSIDVFGPHRLGIHLPARGGPRL